MVLMGAVAFPSVAGAWDMMKSTNGLIIERSEDDTRSTDVYLYYDYKGGSDWNSYGGANNPNYVSSYNANRRFLQLANTGEALEIPLVPGYRCQMLYLADGVKTKTFAVLNEPLAVSGAVTVSAMPSLTLESSVSVAGTLPVNPWGSAGLPDGWVVGVVALGCMLAGGATVTWLTRR